VTSRIPWKFRLRGFLSESGWLDAKDLDEIDFKTYIKEVYDHLLRRNSSIVTGEVSAEHPVTRHLRNTNVFWMTLYASLSAFCLYTCVYAFRKTFPAATYSGVEFAGVSYKVWLVTFQAVGYALAKFIGIKVISELQARSRAGGILLMVSIGGVSWLFFALVPPPYNIIFLFTNGLPLGLVWGMVFGYLEGRRTTEVLGATLSVSFIFSSGICRSVGSWLMNEWNVSEYWMPFTACCIFIVPLLLFLSLLDKIPPPSEEDERMRTRRAPMPRDRRADFTRTFLPGIILFVTGYLLLTTFRDFRENFSAEVWKSLHYENIPSIYSRTEVPVSILVLIIMGSVMFIRNNMYAFMVNHIIIAVGMILIGVSTFLFQQEYITPVIWMTMIGLGLYMGYVPFNSMFFDRMIATFRYVGTVGFIMYVADSFGYLGSISVLFFKEFAYAEMSWLDVFISSGYVISVTGTILIFGSMAYFYWKFRRTARI
jgi:MFS family permease